VSTKPRKKPKGWKQIRPAAISDPRVNLAELPPGQQPRTVLVTELLDHDDMRWIDYHDGDGPQPLGGVPTVTNGGRARSKNDQ